MILLGLLALAAVPGSLLPQRNVASDPNAVLQFTQDNPTLAPWLDRLGLFEVYASPWFAAIYILLLVSMTGCVIPRCLRLWRAVRADPPPAPSSFVRLSERREVHAAQCPSEALRAIAADLKSRGFRVRTTGGEVRAERGYARELGNLLFHLSLLVLLAGIALGRLFGFEGRVALVEGAGFSNVVSQYDEFSPRALTDVEGLEPFSFTLNDFEASFETADEKRGEPRQFRAELEYRPDDGSTSKAVEVEPNHPLDVNETKVFLTGHGYAPKVTVRDGRGDVVFTGPVIFLPNDASYASDGVVKAPDARPTELGFEGFFLPTAAVGDRGPYSAFPDALNPQLFLTAFTGDLGMSDGPPQSVYTLVKDDLQQVRADGRPFAKALSVGDTMRLPNGEGSLTFDGVARFANFQIAYDPGKEVSLVAAALLLLGVTTSLLIRRRRVWVRVVASGPDGTRLEAGALPLTRRGGITGEIDAVLTAVSDEREKSSDRPDTERAAGPEKE
ncbi:cytochrome c biogenesis protein ResB [Nocardioides caldifontis]|uniref:cytochrome c biogenesis protein ResB n=1 Tax=Nocardioides caldifontis TaxID=2588938 RepID=UPI001EF03236|nr:cytochrome c biogenesis protein ResB [Nocardioides caldifontis]